MPVGRNNRSIKNFLINPNFQLKYGIYFAAMGVTGIGLLFLMISLRINLVLEQMMVANIPDIGIQRSIANLLYDVSIYAFLAFIGTGIFSFSFAIYMTHRIAGPAINILSYIDEIKSGQYDTDRRLRKNDDLQAIMASLRDLAASLKAKYKS